MGIEKFQTIDEVRKDVKEKAFIPIAMPRPIKINIKIGRYSIKYEVILKSQIKI